MPVSTAQIEAMSAAEREAILELMKPRICAEYFMHTPHPKQQVYLLQSKVEEVMYGGAAGGGKSDALLMAALQYVDVPGYSALILRRTWPDLNQNGAILDRTKQWLEATDARKRDGGRLWEFPSGAKLSFGYILREDDKLKFQSAEYQFIGFDELTQFQDSQYDYMFSRLRRPSITCLTCGTVVSSYRGQWKHTTKKDDIRSTCSYALPDPKMTAQYGPSQKDGLTLWDVPLRMRSATNPGGPGHDWVYNKFINPKTKNPKTKFIPANLTDNPSLDRASYEEALSHLRGIDRTRLLEGNWEVFESGGIFQRVWFNIVSSVPIGRNVQRVRFWDMASTEGGGDWTVGTLMAMQGGEYWIEHQVRGQWSGQTSEKLIRETALADGQNVIIRMEQEPGSSGKNIIDHYRRNVLYGFAFDGDRPTGSKEARATPLSVAAEKGLVHLIGGEWNKRFLDELELFPMGNFDDQVDSASGAYTALSFTKRFSLIV